jgi:DNA-binding CsgD family transcriptional regulator
LSINTLKTHLSRTYEKTGMANRAMLVKLLVTLSQNA